MSCGKMWIINTFSMLKYGSAGRFSIWMIAQWVRLLYSMQRIHIEPILPFSTARKKFLPHPLCGIYAHSYCLRVRPCKVRSKKIVAWRFDSIKKCNSNQLTEKINRQIINYLLSHLINQENFPEWSKLTWVFLELLRFTQNFICIWQLTSVVPRRFNRIILLAFLLDVLSVNCMYYQQRA